MNKNVLKRFIVFVFCAFAISAINAQSLSTYNEKINISGSYIKSIEGMNLIILKLYDKSEDEYRFYTEIPDTLWIKKVKKPKLDKHYRLYHTYKTLEHIEQGEYTDSKDIVSRVFEIVEVETSDIGTYTSLIVHTLKLCDTENGEIIYMELKNYGKISMVFKLQNTDVLDKLKGEVFVSKDGESEIVKDCYYMYKPYDYDGWELRNTYSKNLTVEFESGKTVDLGNAMSYLTLEEYEAETLKKIEKSANEGVYKVRLSDVIKPNSSKFTGGKVLRESSYYGDNFISIIINEMESGFKFYLSNKSQSTIKINWDNIIYVDEYGFSQRVIHSGVRYIDSNNPQQASLVAQNATISDMIVPVDRIYRTYDYEWSLHPLFYHLHDVGFYNNSQVKVVFPIEIDNVSYEYTFIFEFVWEWTYPDIREQWLKIQEGSDE